VGQLTQERYGAQSEDMRRFRYGVQVNSLGLTEAQPENNVQRIVLEMLGVSLSKKARARAIQLPAWNEALGLPRPWDQQWALRMQQVLAFETDLLEYGDIFDGSPVIAAKVKALVDGATAEMARVQEQGGMVQAIESGYVKRQLVTSHTERMRAIERGDLKIIGLNCYQETEESPLTGGGQRHHESRSARRTRADRTAQRLPRPAQRYRSQGGAGQSGRDRAQRRQYHAGIDLCAHAGVTTGEWSQTLRDIFGEYRAPTGIDIPANDDSRRRESGGDSHPGHQDRRRTGPAAAPVDRQAGSGRSQQRRGTDCGQGSRCRLRDRLRRHPPDPGTNRQGGAGRGRASDRPVGAVRQPCGDGRGRL
jgi:(2R)-ethylmalonyl-CoA mutase